LNQLTDVRSDQVVCILGVERVAVVELLDLLPAIRQVENCRTPWGPTATTDMITFQRTAVDQ